MKKYIKEIVDLGSPVSPKLGRCSPKFRRKILNIVKKVSVITYDNEEEDEFKDPPDEKKRKNSLKEPTELPSVWTVKSHHRAFSLNLQPCSSFDDRTSKSNDVSPYLDCHSACEERVERLYVYDSEQQYSPKQAPGFQLLNMMRISEEGPGSGSGEGSDYGNRRFSEELEGAKPLAGEGPAGNKATIVDDGLELRSVSGKSSEGENFVSPDTDRGARPSLKDELMGFDFNSFAAPEQDEPGDNN